MGFDRNGLKRYAAAYNHRLLPAKTRYSSVSFYCVDQLWTLAMIAKFNALDASLRLGKGEDWRGDLTLASFYPQISSKLTDISHKLTQLTDISSKLTGLISAPPPTTV